MNETIVMEEHVEVFKNHGLSEKEIQNQLETFKKGIPFIRIVAPAAINHGIEKYSETEQQQWIDLFEKEKENLDLIKFVPASGAATRMFKFLHQFLADFDAENDDIHEFLNKKENKDLKTFFESLENFAFYNLVLERLQSKFPDYLELKKEQQYFLFVKEMLHKKGLNFGKTPKGLIPFHRYEKRYKTAFEEQLYEAAFYAVSQGVAKLHFTVSEEHLEDFQKEYDRIISSLKRDLNCDFEISFSFQKKKTDTVAATLTNELFLDKKGNPVFRPGGHGALLENLNDLDADVVFVKNIDNVVASNQAEEIAFYKKMLAGRLLSLQNRIFSYIKILESENSPEKLEAISNFIKVELKIEIFDFSKKEMLKILNRPIRICGVVENTGAPGGGPFLVEDEKGKRSYQIVETAEIDMKNPTQKSLVDRATHFNPVDLVCGVRNYKGEKFDLTKFSNPDSGFIARKSHQGKPIKALERPGLWNGAMANWNTVFVEVPLITFNPVKKVVDLLNPAHQNS